MTFQEEMECGKTVCGCSRKTESSNVLGAQGAWEMVLENAQII